MPVHITNVPIATRGGHGKNWRKIILQKKKKTELKLNFVNHVITCDVSTEVIPCNQKQGKMDFGKLWKDGPRAA